MSDRNMREGLCHTHAGLKDVKFFEMIDASGGWPVGFKYVGFEHTDERRAGFSNSSHNSGWWTTVASADDYYLWKLSPEALQRIANDAIGAFLTSVHYTRPDVTKFSIKTWRSFYRVEPKKESA